MMLRHRIAFIEEHLGFKLDKHGINFVTQLQITKAKALIGNKDILVKFARQNGRTTHTNIIMLDSAYDKYHGGIRYDEVFKLV